jgi:hypothetical protein
MKTPFYRLLSVESLTAETKGSASTGVGVEEHIGRAWSSLQSFSAGACHWSGGRKRQSGRDCCSGYRMMPDHWA